MQPFKPMKVVGVITMACLGFVMLMDLSSVVSSIAQLELLGRMAIGDYTMQEAEANDLRQNLIAVAGLVAFVLSVIAFLVWTYRAYRNVDALGGVRSMGPGWAVGAWFVPILNWFRPFQVVREAWAAPVGRDDPYSAVKAPYWLRLWWGLWIANNLISNIVFRFDETNDIGELIGNTKWFIAADTLSLAAGAAAIVVVHRVTDLQTEAATDTRPENLAEVFA
jgi:hypothetical protein